MNCPECGATDSLCKSRFDECLALEFSDLRYGAVHNLTVATYMLQHSSQLSRDGWLYERDLLREFIVDGKSPSVIRQQVKDSVDSGKRTFKFKSADGKPIIHKTSWKKTILDIRLDDPETYCADVAAWARSVLGESESVGDKIR
jgi:hypothetical protein